MTKDRIRLFTDHDDFFPFGLHAGSSTEDMHALGSNLLKHCISIHIFISVFDEDRKIQYRDALGQACLIKTGKGFALATVKHNFCSETNKAGEFENFRMADLKTPQCDYEIPKSGNLKWNADELTADDAFNFGATDLPDASWKFGNELHLIDLNNKNDPLFQAIQRKDVKAFEAVSTKIEVGMQVGILAHSSLEILSKGMHASLGRRNDQNGEPDYEARKGDSFITVGEITYVGDAHIDYHVNTVHGFSGAPVVLLPLPDEDNEPLKIVAVHAGYSEARETNFGFLVADKIEIIKNGN